ncbi:hypothetical protein MG290_03420 [Flavobacterium sp. CBA20B-1]|uniref:sensor histidine kinase n=1 Tax=unclassified Flavobacterium TaxID=196869 RepID=UPI002224F6C7|nr:MULTISPECIES: ATP-binding protein [unclassified Flavobacterium]WCM42742.1 hypothetical protein MG290_03420 [Flavobacterium sp. CBA20B-1]
MRIVRFIATVILLIVVFSCKKQPNVYDHVKIHTQITNKNYTDFSLDDLYYDLLYDINFAENSKNAALKINYFEETAFKNTDSLAIFRANNLQIALTAHHSVSKERYKTLFSAANYFENNNSLYDAYLTNYLIAEYYFYLQYFQLAENYAYKSIENLGTNNNEYAFEKASTLLLISNIHWQQKKFQEAFKALKNYESVAEYFNTKLIHQEKIKLIESRYANHFVVVESKIGTTDYTQAIKKLALTYHVNSKSSGKNKKIHQLNTLHNLILHKIEANDLDSLDFYLNQLKNEKEFLFSIPVLQLNYTVISDYLVKIKKDTVAAKEFQKNLLIENKQKYQNVFLEKRVLEQLIQHSDSCSVAINQHYLDVVGKIKKENDQKLLVNQKVVYENHVLLRKNAQLKREIYFVVATILTVSLLVLLVIFNIIQKINLKKIKLKNNYIEQDTQALEVTLNYKNAIENKLNESKKQIFMELHDNIVNKLFSTRFSLHKDYMNPNSLAVAANTLLDVKKTLIGICDNYSEINNLFEKDSFHKMLIELIENQPNNFISFQYEFDQSIEWFKTHPKVRFHLYRVLQELLQNIHKHSSATKAKIQIFKEGEHVKLVVTDNGKGFTKTAKKGLGISNISNRLKEIDADFKMENNNGMRFIITVKF